MSEESVSVGMIFKQIIDGVILLAIVIAALYLRYGDVTHESIYRVAVDESSEVKDRLTTVIVRLIRCCGHRDEVACLGPQR